MHQEKLADVGLPPTLFLQRKHNDSLKKLKRMDNEWAWFQWVPGCFCLLLPTQPWNRWIDQTYHVFPGLHLPSGYVKIAIEMAIYSGFSH